MQDIFNYLLLPLTYFGIMSLSAMGLQIILGAAGMLTLGHAAFFAIGGYSSAAFSVLIGPSLGISNPIILFIGAIIFGIFFSALSSCVVVIPCIRLRGDYLAIATLGFGQIVENILYNIPAFGGASGFTNIPHLANIYIVWIAVFLTAFLMNRFYKTALGQSILFSREDELVARCFSVSPEKAKFTAFIIGSSLAGLSGVFYAHTLQFINPPDADFLKSVVILLAVVIGGRFSIHGSILGAGFLILVPELLRFVPRIINTPLNYFVDNGYISSKFSHTLILLLSSNMLIFSILVIIMMKKYPKGLVSLFPSKV